MEELVGLRLSHAGQACTPAEGALFYRLYLCIGQIQHAGEGRTHRRLTFDGGQIGGFGEVNGDYVVVRPVSFPTAAIIGGGAIVFFL